MNRRYSESSGEGQSQVVIGGARSREVDKEAGEREIRSLGEWVHLAFVHPRPETALLFNSETDGTAEVPGRHPDSPTNQASTGCANEGTGGILENLESDKIPRGSDFVAADP